MATASKDSAGWLVNYTIAGAGEKTITFKTEDKFVDADARAQLLQHQVLPRLRCL